MLQAGLSAPGSRSSPGVTVRQQRRAKLMGHSGSQPGRIRGSGDEEWRGGNERATMGFHE